MSQNKNRKITDFDNFFPSKKVYTCFSNFLPNEWYSKNLTSVAKNRDSENSKMVQYIIVPCLEQEICQKMSQDKIRKITDFDNFCLSKKSLHKF